ncbi:MAG: hypothetical protein K2X27_24215 [Candidatus Obscuribacterales bacterium]|nr:hypothetical protein [Candidatus Obscuribacterales bacterium]
MPICFASAASELKDKIPDAGVISSLPTSKVDQQFIESLKSAANFSDYQVGCRLFTQKEEGWKAFGGAQLYYKQKSLIRAVIKSSDYRDGSVVVKEPDGSIKGRGGGLLRSIKMNIEPDSRTIRLPTGYSLTSSDFNSLYEALKANITKGFVATATSSGVNIKLFKDPVQVLVINSGVGSEKKISEVIFIDPHSKLPLAWNTYKDGKPNALVFFEGLVSNKGLSDDLFHI